MSKFHRIPAIIFSLIGFSLPSIAVEHQLKGIVEVSVVNSDSFTSYLDAGYGKFATNDGSQIKLSQLGLHYKADLTETFSANIIANGHADEHETDFGLTEAYLKYQSLPSESGYKITSKLGIYYPHISLENGATAWSSPNTVSFSTLNTWIGEEIRNLGATAELTRLGKYHDSNVDLSLILDAFTNNDTTGALISWHGWTMSNRQSYWQQRVAIPLFPALATGDLAGSQSPNSDPFVELDDRFGGIASLRAKWAGKGEIIGGFYNNNADTRVVKGGQYAWLTRFSHFGAKFKLSSSLFFSAQYIDGYTRMNAPTGMVVVENRFHSGFVSFAKRWKQHQLTLRVEEFKVSDHDTLVGDNNNEYGKAATLSYRYQWDRQWFVLGEFNKVNSRRDSRYYFDQPVKAQENQFTVALRYYF